MAKELAKTYEPQEVEDRIYDFWMNGNYFHAEVDPNKTPYTIVIPPPNITGDSFLDFSTSGETQSAPTPYGPLTL